MPTTPVLSPVSASTRGRSTTVSSTATVPCSGTRGTTATAAPTAWPSGSSRRCPPTSSTGSTGCSTCRSPRSTSCSRATGAAQTELAEQLLLDPRPPRALAHRGARHRAHERQHHRAARRDDGGVVHAGARTPRACVSRCSRRCARPARWSGRCSRRCRRRPASVRDVVVTTVGSHDTASAVVGVPAENERFAYVACGTWALVGVELDAPVLTRRQPRGQLHQRGRRRRHRPLPAQRHGALGALGVDPHLGAAGSPSRSGHAARRGRAAAVRRTGRRHRRPVAARTGRHAVPHRRALPRVGPGRPRVAGGDGPVHRRQPGGGVRPCGVGRGAPVRSRGRRRPRRRRRLAATRCSASSPPRRPGCRCSPDRSRRRPSATCSSRPAPTATSSGDLAELRALVRATHTLQRYEPARDPA